MSQLEVDKVIPQSGTTLTLGESQPPHQEIQLVFQVVM
jgi:hypothetical protein